MTRIIVCPGCGESERLSGSRGEDGIEVECESCGASWQRDSVPGVCATCGASDLETRPQAMTQYARGTQVPIVGFRHAPLCRHCDVVMLERSREGKPIPTQLHLGGRPGPGHHCGRHRYHDPSRPSLSGMDRLGMGPRRGTAKALRAAWHRFSAARSLEQRCPEGLCFPDARVTGGCAGDGFPQADR